MKTADKKIVIGIVLANIFLIIFIVCGKILTRFDYKDHFDDTVISIDSENITLREFGYYIYKVESFVQNQALLYDPENPKHWWNTHFSAGMDSQFVCDYAKKVALNTCICDQIYYLDAIDSGYVPDAATNAQILQESNEMFLNMSSSQLEATGLNKELVTKMHKRHVIAAQYVRSISQKLDFSQYDKEPDELLNWDGEYYQKELLPKHEVKPVDKILDQLTLGKITVNRSN